MVDLGDDDTLVLEDRHDDEHDDDLDYSPKQLVQLQLSISHLFDRLERIVHPVSMDKD